MFNVCCVVGCSSRRKHVKLFKFREKTEIGLRYWLKCVHGLGNKVFRNLYVCEKHFEKRFVSSKSRLRLNAYPSLFTDDEIASGVPSTSNMDIDTVDHGYCETQHNDHNYAKKFTASNPDTELTSLNIISESKNNDNYISDIKMAPSCIANNEMQPSSSRTSDVDMVLTIADARIKKDSCISTKDVETRVISTPKASRNRRRLVHAIKALTPQCRKLYKVYKKSQKQLDFYKRAKRAINFNKGNSIFEITKNINPLAKKILWMQITQCNKSIKGRRFKMEEKLISLAIMKQSPKCYRFLQKIFILPSKQTLNKFTASLNIDTGINAQIFEAIKQEVSTWQEHKKYCSILFDEVALEPGVTYDRNKDTIDGFVDVGIKLNEIADHALVFMLRGSVFKWQQPIVYYFCKGATASIQLKNILKSIVTAVIDTGLLPIALVSDQGTSFQSALKMLQEETKREQIRAGEVIDDVIIINSHTLSVIYDPPHLLKGLRNNFLNKNIKFKGKLSKWSDIVEVYKTDCGHAQMRLLHKLNDEHVIPEKIKKMKVKNCTRVFSKTMAATLSYTAQFSNYTNGKKVSPTLKNTAEIISLFDDLFDSVNGSTLNCKKNKGKPLRSAVTNSSAHHQFWRQTIQDLENLKYVDDSGKESSVPSLKNWITTLKSYARIWKFLQSKNIKIMRPRYFNSDPLENFFGQVRAYNFRNNNPDCHTFKCTFRSLLITRLIKFHSSSFNCEEDSGEQLLKLKALFKNNNSTNNDNSNNDHENNLANSEKSNNDHEMPHTLHESSVSRNFNAEKFCIEASRERLNVHSHAYTAGWVIRKVLKNINCSQCNSNYISKNKQQIHTWISQREYKVISKNEHKLTYPAEKAVRLFRKIINEGNEYLEKKSHEEGIIKKMKQHITSKYSSEYLACECHENINELFLEYTLRLNIFNWCTIINKILNGKDVIRLENKSLPEMQLKAYNKFKTKLRNKNLKK